MNGPIVLATDLLCGAPDMGERVYVRGVASALSRRGVPIISFDGVDEVASESIDAGRGLVSFGLSRILKRLRPRAILYPQRSSLTFGGVFRVGRLRSLSGAEVVPIAFQPRELGTGWRLVAQRWRPPRVLVLSEATANSVRRLWPGVSTRLVPAAIDERFRPVTGERRVQLRERFGWGPDKRVVLHVGHLSRSRGIEAMAEIARADSSNQVVVVASSSTEADTAMRSLLESAGVTVIEGYVEAVQEYYQAADVYVFPVTDPRGCIGAPISLFEALASGLPVATTPFGDLPSLLGDMGGIEWIPDVGGIAEAVAVAAAHGVARDPRYHLGWDDAARALLDAVEELS